MESYEQNLHIAGSAFESMRHDADKVLQKLLKNMAEKESLEGNVTIKIDITLRQEFIQNTDPDIEGETRRVLTPAFTHKVGSMMQIKDEAKGGINYEGMEMVWDEETNEYVVKPIANTTQRTIFDADFQCVSDPDEYEDEEESEQNAISESSILALPAPTDAEEPEDLSDEMTDMEEIPFDDDDYDYDEPEEF